MLYSVFERRCICAESFSFFVNRSHESTEYVSSYGGWEGAWEGEAQAVLWDVKRLTGRSLAELCQQHQTFTFWTILF